MQSERPNKVERRRRRRRSANSSGRGSSSVVSACISRKEQHGLTQTRDGSSLRVERSVVSSPGFVRGCQASCINSRGKRTAMSRFRAAKDERVSWKKAPFSRAVGQSAHWPYLVTGTRLDLVLLVRSSCLPSHTSILVRHNGTQQHMHHMGGAVGVSHRLYLGRVATRCQGLDQCQLPQAHRPCRLHIAHHHDSFHQAAVRLFHLVGRNVAVLLFALCPRSTAPFVEPTDR